MTEYAGINVRLSREEFFKLRDSAAAELRHPRDQARYLLRQALGLSKENANRGAVVESEPQRAAVAK